MDFTEKSYVKEVLEICLLQTIPRHVSKSQNLGGREAMAAAPSDLPKSGPFDTCLYLTGTISPNFKFMFKKDYSRLVKSDLGLRL